MEKINILKIFKDHIGTFYHFDTKKFIKLDFFFFYIIPLIIGIVVSFVIDISFLVEINNDLITFYSVMGGFMLNLLVLVYGYDRERYKKPELAKIVLKEISSNISYLIAVSLILIVFLFGIRMIDPIEIGLFKTFKNYDQFVFITRDIIVTFVVASFINFFLTILMVVKRFYSLESNRQ